MGKSLRIQIAKDSEMNDTRKEFSAVKFYLNAFNLSKPTSPLKFGFIGDMPLHYWKGKETTSLDQSRVEMISTKKFERKQGINETNDPKEKELLFVERRYCTACNLEQPFRAKHCKDCNKCVAQYDHHCPWLGIMSTSNKS